MALKAGHRGPSRRGEIHPSPDGLSGAKAQAADIRKQGNAETD